MKHLFTGMAAIALACMAMVAEAQPKQRSEKRGVAEEQFTYAEEIEALAVVDILRRAGFTTLPPLGDLKRQAGGYAPLNVTVADGWLVAAEIVGWAGQGVRKILCVQPFACLPGHIFGKGQYAALQRKLPGVRLVSVDYDASTGEGTVQSRVRMLLDEELPV